MATQIPKWATTLNDDDWKLVAFAVEVLEDRLQFGNDIDDWSDSDYERKMDRLSNMVRGWCGTRLTVKDIDDSSFNMATTRGSDMKIATYETGFADMGRISKENPCNGIELFEDDGSEDGGKRWAILSNDLPEKAVREIVGILTNWVPLISLPQRPGTAGMAN